MKTAIMPQKLLWRKIIFAALGCTLALTVVPRTFGGIVVNSIGNHRTIGVQFPIGVTDPTASDPTHYIVNGGDILVTNVIRQPDGQSVNLFLNAPVGEFFSVEISNVVDILSGVFNTTVTGFFSDYDSDTIGTPGDPVSPGHVFTALKDTFTITAGGSDIGGTSDHCHFVHQTVVGDFDMTVLVTQLDNTDPESKAGLMMRENLAPGSRTIHTVFTPSQGLGVIESSIRSTTGGNTVFFGTPGLSSEPLHWLRMTRVTNLFTTYDSTNGSDWVMTGAISLTTSNSLEVGMVVSAHTPVQATTAAFTSFGVWGSRPGDGVLPTLQVSMHQTNFILKWQRTPRDFTVEVSTNLIRTDEQTNTDNATIPTQWSLLMLPVFDTALTGTNAMMQTPGRYMVVPKDLFPEKTVFMRLAQVDRVIPDPILVTPGIILSQAGGNMMSATTGSTLCSKTVDSATALAQCGTPLLCPKGHTYEFDTSYSGATLQTVLQVRNYPSIGATTCNGVFSAGSGKARVTVVNTTQTGYTFVVAATTAVKPTLTNPLKVQINIK